MPVQSTIRANILAQPTVVVGGPPGPPGGPTGATGPQGPTAPTGAPRLEEPVRRGRPACRGQQVRPARRARMPVSLARPGRPVRLERLLQRGQPGRLAPAISPAPLELILRLFLSPIQSGGRARTTSPT